MKKIKNQVIYAATLILISALLYYLQYTLFKDVRNTVFYLLQDLAFVPIQILLVTLILQQILEYREKNVFLRKLNMVIGSFFSELGNPLLKQLSNFDSDYAVIRENFIITNTWTDAEFAKAFKYFKHYNFNIDLALGNLDTLKIFLMEKKSFVLRLLANPNLLEHDRFSELLWAIHHLNEELYHRKELAAATDPDKEHLAKDVKRAYSLLIIEWFEYMSHLKKDYPYLFSLAVRTNPYDASASIEIQ